MGLPTHVQSASTESNTSTADVAMGSNVTSGDILLLFHADSNSGTVSTPVKQAGTATLGTITAVGVATAQGSSQGQSFKCQVTGSGSLTIRFSATAGVVSGVVTEIKPAGGDTIDVDGALHSTTVATYSGTLANTPTLTSVPASDFVWAAATIDSTALTSQSVNAGASTPNTGWTMGTHLDDSTNAPIEAGYNQGGAASNYTCQFTETGATGTWDAVHCTVAVKGTPTAQDPVFGMRQPIQGMAGLPGW